MELEVDSLNLSAGNFLLSGAHDESFKIQVTITSQTITKHASSLNISEVKDIIIIIKLKRDHTILHFLLDPLRQYYTSAYNKCISNRMQT